ncbi:unnamed protein product [Psylliodes chrysocephalus]|uniref:Uncharacterized protein n=1 Tax=Psylliodes chrysocephalus TaxID=3402493 RepID=A0A9P0D4U5_9CUCU|nr:unnamed protein product [Psylliodes chrysocephala]
MDEIKRGVASFSQNVTPRRGVYDMNFKEIVKVNVAVLETCAVMVPDLKGPNDTFWFLIRLFIYLVGIYGTQVVSEVLHFILLNTSIQELAAASFLFLTHAVQITKVFYLFKYRLRVRKLINCLNQPIFQPQSDKQRTTLTNYIKLSKFASFSFLTAGVLTCIFWATYPFTEDELKLPLAGWFPFDTTVSPNFELAYTYQCMATTLNGITIISIDTLWAGKL